MLQSHRLHFYMQDFIRGHIYKHSEAQGYIAWQYMISIKCFSDYLV